MTIALYILAIIAVITLTFLAVDLFCTFQTWQRRIGIGRWKDRNKWEEAITNRAVKWFQNPPVVSKRDNTRYILWDKINNNYKNNTIQNWQTAGLLLGLSFPVKKIELTESIDDALIGYVYLTNNKNHNANVSELNAIYSTILSLKQDNGTIPYRKQLPNIRFVDTVGLICPFLVKYGLTFANNDAIELAKAQICEFSRFLHPITGTPPHAYDIKKDVPLGIYDWGRGIGWYLLGITECYRIVPSGDFHDFLQKQILSLGESLLKHQLPSGGFAASLFCENAPAESSATVLCGLLFQQCFEITGNEKYYNATDLVISQLMKLTQRNGAIDMSQGDTKGIGLYSSKYSYMPFTQGLTLLLLERVKNAHA